MSSGKEPVGGEGVINSTQMGSRREQAMFKQDLEVAHDFAKGRQ